MKITPQKSHISVGTGVLDCPFINEANRDKSRYKFCSLLKNTVRVEHIFSDIVKEVDRLEFQLVRRVLKPPYRFLSAHPRAAVFWWICAVKKRIGSLKVKVSLEAYVNKPLYDLVEIDYSRKRP